MASPVVTRFAPSPTGYLHLGHVLAAATAWRAARETGGRFLVRLEDIDTGRCRAEFAEAALEDLRWLGLDWDGEVRVQSEHLREYAAALGSLAERELVYPCFCSRADVVREIAESASAPQPGADGGPLYPGTCRGLSAADRAARIGRGEPHAWRLDMQRALKGAPALNYGEAGGGRVVCRPEAFGDLVIGRRDAPAGYHLCVTHDDARQGVSLVTRGDDLRLATDVHCLLQHLMGWPRPGYRHHALRLGPDGRRLSKRDGAASVRTLRDAGMSKFSVVEMACGFVARAN